jgi:phosphohistidine phosphatase
MASGLKKPRANGKKTCEDTEMRSLYLIRHAKSDWAHDGLADIDRPLNARGYRDAQRMGEALAARAAQPDSIVSSPAVRAVSTALIFARALRYPSARVKLDDRLYEPEADAVLEVIGEQDAAAQTLFVFGHNPTWSSLASQLAQGFFGELPTTGLVVIRFDAPTWREAVQKRGELVLFDFPKNHN